MKLINQLTQYIKDAIAELKKVSWPTKKQTTNYTLLVIAISLTVALFLGILDFFLSLGVQQIIK